MRFDRKNTDFKEENTKSRSFYFRGMDANCGNRENNIQCNYAFKIHTHIYMLSLLNYTVLITFFKTFFDHRFSNVSI